jgi:hypothetical protein
MQLQEGKYTVETFAQERGITRQAALNLLSKLKRQGFVQVSGGGKQKRIYSISTLPQTQTNGFYTLVNQYSPEKLAPRFKHRVIGTYTIEHAITDGIMIGDVRTLQATMHLFRHITSWKRLFDLAKKHGLVKEVRKLYAEARATTRCKTMPKRYST